MRRTKKEPSPAIAAACGAAAGLIGGLALTGLDRVVLPRMGAAAQRERDWDDRVAHSLARLGIRLSPRDRATAGIAAGLAYAALLGAGYGLARRRLKSSPDALRLLDALLVYAASLVAPARRRLRNARRPLTRSAAMGAVSSGAVFGMATTAAYQALSRRVG